MRSRAIESAPCRYYVLPFLFGDRLVARVDAIARRHTGALDTIAIHYEEARPSADVRDALRASLAELAAWLGLTASYGRK